MLLNRKFFSKKTSVYHNRFHMDDVDTPKNIAEQLQAYLTPYLHRDIVFVCIGTDRSTGDSLGPLIGTKLLEKNIQTFHVYGTLDDPVHALNLEDKMKEIHEKHRRSYVVGIDACLGRLNSVGQITIASGPVKPGAAVHKKLPKVGDIHMTGIVNIGEMMEYVVLQNTRLSVVMKMATIIADSIYSVDQIFTEELSKRVNILQSVTPKVFIRDKKEL